MKEWIENFLIMEIVFIAIFLVDGFNTIIFSAITVSSIIYATFVFFIDNR